MILRRVLAGAAGLALVATPALARRPERAPGVGTANPSALIAAEIAFARLALSLIHI